MHKLIASCFELQNPTKDERISSISKIIKQILAARKQLDSERHADSKTRNFAKVTSGDPYRSIWVTARN